MKIYSKTEFAPSSVLDLNAQNETEYQLHYFWIGTDPLTTLQQLPQTLCKPKLH